MPDAFQPSLKPFRDLESPESASSPALPVAGFWLRTAAFAADVGLLTLVYSAAARHAYEVLYPARTVTQLLGALLVFVYFWVGNSSLTKGRTVGKAFLNIRTISVAAGGNLSGGKAALRAALIQLLVYSYLFLLFPLFSFACALVLGARMPLTFLHFPFSAEGWLCMMSLGIVSAGYAFSNAVFCGLHPKKSALHDLVAKTAVVRKGEEEAALVFLGEWDETAKTRLKLARWPAGVLAVIFLVLLVRFWTWAVPGFEKSKRPQARLRQTLKVNGCEPVAVVGPSAEEARRFEERRRAADAERAARNLDPLTTQSLRLLQNGRKMHFYFVNDAVLTSESLVALPNYAEIVRQLPPLAREMSAEFFLDKDGKPAPYADIQVEFMEILPLYLYSKSRLVWADLIPAGNDAATSASAESSGSAEPGGN